MNYEKIYQDFYSKYYSKVEILIKNSLIKRHSEKRTFDYSIEEVRLFLINDFRNRFISYNNQNLYQTFIRSRRFYTVDVIQEVFNNEVQTEFDTIDVSEFPVNYSYSKFIKEIALIEVENEISSLLSENSRLLKMIYKSNEFDLFEIRRYKGLSLEDTPLFIKLQSELYPDELVENTDFEFIETELIDFDNTSATDKIIYLQKLGIIDFLKTKQPFQSSRNSLATVLSAVIGEKATTIQPMINPILSKDVDSKNNPLNSKKAVSRVEKQLINIGFNLSETI